MDRREFKILVADDDDIALDVVSSILSREGYSVIPVHNGIEAINKLTESKVGLVITDLRMPGADGLEVLKKAVSLCSDTAVVILTAFSTLDTTLEAMRLGAYDYLTKPFKAQEIAIVAERAFKRAGLMEENRHLRRLIKDTYMDVLELGCRPRNSEMARRAMWLERIKRLEALSVLTSEEAGLMKERLVMQNGEGEPSGDR